MRGLDVGDYAPDFTLASTEGPVRLFDVLEQGAVLLVFYPRDHTLVCTRQLCNYRDHLSGFEDLGVQILAVNDDPLESHEAFASKYGFGFPLASDPGGRVCRVYGALRGALRLQRLLVLVGEDGHVWWRHEDLRLFHRKANELQQVIGELRRER